MFESWAQKMGAGSLFFVFCPKKTPFLLVFLFFVSPVFAGFLVQNLDFHRKRALFLSRPGEVVVKWAKTAHFCSQGNAMSPKHATTARLKMPCTFEGCFKSLWCPHQSDLKLKKVTLVSGHVASPGHPSRAALSRTGEISLLTTWFPHTLWAYTELPEFLVTFYRPMCRTLHHQPLYGITCPVP